MYLTSGQIEDYRQFQYFEYCCSYILYIYFDEIGLICILMKDVFALRLWWAAWELKEGLGSKSILMRKLTAEKAEICNAHCTNTLCNSVKNTKYKVQYMKYDVQTHKALIQYSTMCKSTREKKSQALATPPLLSLVNYPQFSIHLYSFCILGTLHICTQYLYFHSICVLSVFYNLCLVFGVLHSCKLL